MDTFMRVGSAMVGNVWDDTDPFSSSRRLTDASGDWLVYERVNRGVRSLIFESEPCCRRVSIFPAGWRELSPEALMVLSWKK